jgi:hypothetical protein
MTVIIVICLLIAILLALVYLIVKLVLQRNNADGRSTGATGPIVPLSDERSNSRYRIDGWGEGEQEVRPRPARIMDVDE